MAARPPNPLPTTIAATTAALLLSTTPLPAAPIVPPTPPQSTTLSQISDTTRILPTNEALRLNAHLQSLHSKTGLTIRIITLPTPTPLPQPLPSTITILLDPTAGNVLTFRNTPPLPPTLPSSFFTEAANRFGNTFYIRENGPDRALLAVISAIEQCATSTNICTAVPGVSSDQFAISLTSAAIAGAVFGAASRTGGKPFNTKFVALFSPLWAIFLVSFGLGPVLARGPHVTWELSCCMAAFVTLAGLVWAWVPKSIGKPGEDASKM